MILNANQVDTGWIIQTPDFNHHVIGQAIHASNKVIVADWHESDLIVTYPTWDMAYDVIESAYKHGIEIARFNRE